MMVELFYINSGEGAVMWYSLQLCDDSNLFKDLKKESYLRSTKFGYLFHMPLIS